MQSSNSLTHLAQSSRWRVLAATITLVAGGAGFVACASGDSEREVDLATSADPLQSVYIGFSESDTTRGVNLVTTSSLSRKGKSTGALRTFTAKTNGLPATCGVTFVSHHFAVTAAHCVDGFDPDTAFTIEQYDTTKLNMNAVYSSDNIGPTGTNPWPNYTKTSLTSANGYKVTSYSCQLKRRCYTSGTAFDCRMGTIGSSEEKSNDLAMLYCGNRSTSTVNWVPVAANTEAGRPIEVWWFHEVVDLAVNGNDPYNPYQPYFNWQHYGQRTGDLTQNWHYNHPNITLQPLPLVSKHNKNNQQYYPGTIGTYKTASPVPSCHGTSGSGVMLANADAIVGVVNTEGNNFGSQVLCSDMNSTLTDMMNYASRAKLATFVNVSEVTGDRQ